ncbi:MAG: ogr/Delta-like zinc finger family protein [Victivallales bacterium]|nr:ogr/Delta-like zinc finger family protein [Victivallales bacterium]
MSDPKPDPEMLICPHCGGDLVKWAVPVDSTWGVPYQYVCFNDECSYFVGGWKFMMEKFRARASYRYRFNPFNGETGPLPVWSFNAMKSSIMKEA